MILMDQDFTVQSGVKQTGVLNGLLISNFSRSDHLADFVETRRVLVRAHGLNSDKAAAEP